MTRPIDCGHLFEQSPVGDYYSCRNCGMAVIGESVEAVRRKLPNGEREPLRDAVNRAARIQLQAD